MANPKIVNIYCESENVSVVVVSNSTKADIIIRKNGSVSTVTHRVSQENIVSEGNIESDVFNVLAKMGMPEHVIGYPYVTEAIKLIVNRPEVIHSVTKIIYPEITKMFDVPLTRVERSIRNAIEITWLEGNFRLQDEFFRQPNYLFRHRPANSEFLFCMAEYVKILRKNIS